MRDTALVTSALAIRHERPGAPSRCASRSLRSNVSDTQKALPYRVQFGAAGTGDGGGGSDDDDDDDGTCACAGAVAGFVAGAGVDVDVDIDVDIDVDWGLLRYHHSDSDYACDDRPDSDCACDDRPDSRAGSRHRK